MHYTYKTEEWAKVSTKKAPSDDLAEFIEKRDREGWELFSVHLENAKVRQYRLLFRKAAPEIDRIEQFMDTFLKGTDAKKATAELMLDELARLLENTSGFSVKRDGEGEKILVSVDGGWTVEIRRSDEGDLFLGEKGRSNDLVDVGRKKKPKTDTATPLDALVMAVISSIVTGSPGLIDPKAQT